MVVVYMVKGLTGCGLHGKGSNWLWSTWVHPCVLGNLRLITFVYVSSFCLFVLLFHEVELWWTTSCVS